MLTFCCSRPQLQLVRQLLSLRLVSVEPNTCLMLRLSAIWMFSDNAGVVCSFSECPVEEGMGTPDIIPEDRLTSNVNPENIQSIRPGQPGKWTAPVAEEPMITVQLVEEGDEPVPIGEVAMISNVPSFTVLYQEDDEEPRPVTSRGSEEPKASAGCSRM